MTNRDGRLTPDQWKQIVAEPLVTLMVLMIPGIFVLGPRLGAFIIGGSWLIGLMVIAGLGLMLLLRAIRYARAPLHMGTFYAGEETGTWWMFWKPEVMYNESDKPVRFHKRLAPPLPTRPGGRYLVYYLKDADKNVLLSIAPADHADANRWQPTAAFQARFARRSGG